MACPCRHAKQALDWKINPRFGHVLPIGGRVRRVPTLYSAGPETRRRPTVHFQTGVGTKSAVSLAFLAHVHQMHASKSVDTPRPYCSATNGIVSIRAVNPDKLMMVKSMARQSRRSAPGQQIGDPTGSRTQPSASESRNDEAVARRAYELYEQRGRGDGHDWEDWLLAEREMASGTVRTAAMIPTRHE